MPRSIACERVRQLAGGGAQLIEVLPRREYEEQHLPGARSIPLKEMDARRTARLDRATPVVVYCWDSI